MFPRVLSILIAGAAVLGAQAPSISSGGIINAAAAVAGEPVAQGSLISIFGTNLAASQQAADSIPLSTSLSDVTSVQVNGATAPLTFVSPGQINAQVPWSVQPGTANVVVNRSAGSSAPQTVQVAAIDPAVFFYPAPGGQLLAIALNLVDYHLAWPQGAVNGVTTQPVQRGQGLLIYANGLGPVNPPANTGDMTGSTLTYVTTPVTVLIGGVAVQPQFAGMAPQFVGVNQINIVVPANAPTGLVPLQIVQGNVTSSSQVMIAVQ